MIGFVVVLMLFAATLTFLATATFVGSRLPAAHRVSRTARYAEPVARVWEAVSDPRIGFGAHRFEQATPVPGRVLIRRIVGEAELQGTWTYELEPDGSGTRLTITEDAEIRSALFRFVSRFALGRGRSLDAYLETLRRSL